MRAGRGAAVGLAVFIFLGLLAGIWIVVAPWVLGYSPPAGAQWSHSQLSTAAAGAVVIGVSAVALVAVVTSLAGPQPPRLQPRPEDETERLRDRV
ncbi:MAG: hypothetical protein J2P45_02210 [Candidatus Dormibacteraeota bacterium]|nr:hypothetical protein [Candidatus Dormibacteraeota bacterium]